MTAAEVATADAVDSPQKVLDLLREQARLYEELESYATKQHSLVTDDCVGPLLAILAARQNVSTALAQIGQRLSPVRTRWSTYRRRFNEAQRIEADRLLDEASRRLKNVMKGDEQDVRVLSGRKQAIAGALRTTHSTSQAVAAYGGPVPDRHRLGRVNEQS